MNEKYLAPKYSHKEVEAGKYDYWLKNGFFASGDISKKPYSIVIPPPNVTGKLHLGHAWNTTLQDIIIRQKRMAGYDCLWLPGMDHVYRRQFPRGDFDGAPRQKNASNGFGQGLRSV